MDPMGILKSTREFKAPGAGKEHTSAVRGGGRDPGVRRPGSGLGRPTARSKFFRAAGDLANFLCILGRDDFFLQREQAPLQGLQVVAEAFRRISSTR